MSVEPTPVRQQPARSDLQVLADVLERSEAACRKSHAILVESERLLARSRVARDKPCPAKRTRASDPISN